MCASINHNRVGRGGNALHYSFHENGVKVMPEEDVFKEVPTDCVIGLSQVNFHRASWNSSGSIISPHEFCGKMDVVHDVASWYKSRLSLIHKLRQKAFHSSRKNFSDDLIEDITAGYRAIVTYLRVAYLLRNEGYSSCNEALE